jgi:predicted transcriptional regulator
MHALKARVESGRYVIDEPAQLPEGAEVELAIVARDELDERGRAARHASLDRALDDEDAGRFVDTDNFLAEVDAGT